VQIQTDYLKISQKIKILMKLEGNDLLVEKIGKCTEQKDGKCQLTVQCESFSDRAIWCRPNVAHY
jgi:hypothetical protein